MQGAELSIPDATAELTHLQFRRYASCPICNHHLRGFFRNAARLQAARIREVIFFHSSAREMLKYQKQIAHFSVADPELKLYARFGVGRSMWASRHPRALWAALRGMLQGNIGHQPENGTSGLPADFMIDASGKVVAVKYGTHAYDQWDIEEVFEIANANRSGPVDKSVWHWPDPDASA